MLGYLPGAPLALIEVGWPSLEALGGEAAQRDFLSLAAGQLTRGQGATLHLLGWAWLHDMDPSDTMGLLRRDGSGKAAYGAWKEIAVSGS